MTQVVGGDNPATSARTIDDHLRGKPPNVVALFERFVAAVRADGPVEFEPLKDQVVLHGSRRIFGSLRATNQGLRGHLNLPRRVDDPRFVWVEPLTKRLFYHRFVLSSASELDDAFVGWLHEAYAVGRGAHLRPGEPGIAGRRV